MRLHLIWRAESTDVAITLKTTCKPSRPVIFCGGQVQCSWVSDTALTWSQQQRSGRLAGVRHGRWLINILKCQIWVQPEMNPPTTCIGYSKWDISPSKWDMPIIACNTTMAELVRSIPLFWDCDMPYSQITQAAAASQWSWIQYAWRYQNSSVRESQEPSSICQCHDIIMSLSDRVLNFTGEMDNLDTFARLLSYMYVQHLLPARLSHSKQLEVKEEEIYKTMSSA